MHDVFIEKGTDGIKLFANAVSKRCPALKTLGFTSDRIVFTPSLFKITSLVSLVLDGGEVRPDFF